jgi:hypothetical protein
MHRSDGCWYGCNGTMLMLRSWLAGWLAGWLGLHEAGGFAQMLCWVSPGGIPPAVLQGDAHWVVPAPQHVVYMRGGAGPHACRKSSCMVAEHAYWAVCSSCRLFSCPCFKQAHELSIGTGTWKAC